MRFLKTWRLQDEVTIRLKTWSSFFQRHIYRSTLLSELLQHVRLKTWIRKMMILDCNTLKFSKFSHHTLNLAWANVIWWTQFDIYPSKRLLFTVSTFKTMTIQWYWYTLYHIEWKRCLRLQKWTVIAKMWTVQKNHSGRSVKLNDLAVRQYTDVKPSSNYLQDVHFRDEPALDRPLCLTLAFKSYHEWKFLWALQNLFWYSTWKFFVIKTKKDLVGLGFV